MCIHLFKKNKEEKNELSKEKKYREALEMENTEYNYGHNVLTSQK